MNSKKNKSRLEIGNNWWSRGLQTLFWLIIALAFFASIKREISIINLVISLINSLLWSVALLGIWRFSQWIVNGNNERNANEIPFFKFLAFVLVCFVLLLAFYWLFSRLSRHDSTNKNSLNKRNYDNFLYEDNRNIKSIPRFFSDLPPLPPKYVYRDPGTLFCPSNVQDVNGGVYCKCAEEYTGNISRTACIPLPNNAHPVHSLSNAWLCNDGFKETGNSCQLLVR